MFHWFRLSCVGLVLVATLGFDEPPRTKITLETAPVNGSPNGFCYSPDGKLIAGGTNMSITENNLSRWHGDANLWDARTGKLIRTFSDHGGHVSWTTFCDGGKTLVAVSPIKPMIRVWDIGTGELRRSIALEDEEICISNFYPIVVSPDGSRIILGTATPAENKKSEVMIARRLKSWSLVTGKLDWKIEITELQHLTFSPGQNELLVFDAEQSIVELADGSVDSRYLKKQYSRIEPATGKLRGTLTFTMECPSALVYLRQGKYVCAADQDAMEVREIKSGRLVCTFKFDESRLAFPILTPSADGTKLARVGIDFIEIFDFSSGKLVLQEAVKLPVQSFHTAMSPDLSQAALIQTGQFEQFIINLKDSEHIFPK